MSTNTPTIRPTYGNFQPTRRGGVYGIPIMGLGFLLAGAAVGFVLLIGGNLGAAMLWTGFLVLATAPVMKRNAHDRNLYQVIGTRIAFMSARRAGSTVYLAGGAGRVPDGRCRLPGLLAASELTEHLDGYGQPFGLLYVPATEHYSIVLVTHPADPQLMDDDVIDEQVNSWGGFLADLGSQPSVEAASVTIETAPDSGLRLRQNIASQLDRDAPVFGAAALGEMAETFPTTSAQVTTKVTITWTAVPSWSTNEGSGMRKGKPRPRSREEMAVEIGNLLPALAAGLMRSGAGATVHAATAQDIVDSTRVAYDPAVALTVEEARATGRGTGLSWDDAGPTGAVEAWNSYRHDRGFSRTWYMSAPHRGDFPAKSIGRLLAPHTAIPLKRVTILYRPEPAVRAAEIVDRAYLDATSEATQKSRPTARDKRAVVLAQRTADDEAAGAALIRFSVIVTATVLDPKQLDLATVTVETLAAGPRLRMRPVVGNQAVAFAAGLPLGLVLPKHTILTADLRDQMI